MWQCRIAPSLGGGFAGTPNDVWGTDDYTDIERPTVFFGLYGLPDFYTLWRHKGKKAILWCGSDITNFANGYWLGETEWEEKLDPKPLASWINRNCESYVENEVEYEALKKLGIESKVVPSFLGDVDDYKVCYTPSDKPKVYSSVSGDEFILYGWDKIPKLAKENPNIEFHLYGASDDLAVSEFFLDEKNNINFGSYGNVFRHGRVSQEQMNEEIKGMQGALRLTEFDGASEIIVKAMLWGQYAFSFIPYSGVDNVSDLHLLPYHEDANLVGRDWWLSNLNKYPWNEN